VKLETIGKRFDYESVFFIPKGFISGMLGEFLLYKRHTTFIFKAPIPSHNQYSTK
jgi:hypothetical protein